MNPMVRAVAGGVCVGAGIAVGAYSGGWFLLATVVLGLLGIATVAGPFVRAVTTASAGKPVPVQVELVDRSASNSLASSTLVAGEARPDGDVPFRFQTRAHLSDAQVADIVHDGNGTLPSDALGEPGNAPVTEHRAVRAQVPAAVAAVAAMWATILLPPSGFWDVTPISSAGLAVVHPAPGPDERPLWQWYDDALAHLRDESPESLDSILQIAIYDTYVDVKVYLGGDRMRVYEGRTRGWEVTEQPTNYRDRDTFSAADVQGFVAREFLSEAAGMLPEAERAPERLELARSTDDIYGAVRPPLAEAWFGDDSTLRLHALGDGTVAPWWSAEDLPAGLRQVGDALTARGIAADALQIKEITLNTSGDGSFGLDYYRGDTYFSTTAKAGDFADADDKGSNSDFPRFRFTDLDPAVLTRVRDDAMRRYSVDPVDRGTAEITIKAWGSDGGARQDEVVIAVDYHSAHGDTAFYTLGGDHLAG